MAANLSINSVVAPSSFDLTANGPGDWLAVTGANATARKNLTTALLTFIKATAASNSYFTSAALTINSWSDGTAGASSANGAVYNGTAAGGGYSITAPAGTSTRTLTLIVGAYRCTTRVTATLSDGSAPSVNIAAATNPSGSSLSSQGLVTITYATASDGQTLTVTVLTETPSSQGAANFQSMALSAVAANVPDAPTIGAASAGNASASVNGTPPANNGGSPIIGYRATSTPGGIIGTSTSLPVNVTGLTNGVAYTFKLAAQNDQGYGPESAASNSVTPANVNNPPVFGGAIANISGTAGSPIAPVNAAAAFSDTDTLTYSASPVGAVWPTGLSINSATGEISGTIASAGTTSGLRARATDTASQTADSNAFDVVIAAAGSNEIPITDPNVFWSPYNWDDYGTYRSANNCGAYAKLGFSGTSIAVKIDVSHMVSVGLSASQYPIVRTIIDGIAFVDTQLTSSTTALNRSGLTDAGHTLEVVFLAAHTTTPDRWSTPVSAVRIAGFTLDTGKASSPVATRSKKLIFYGDSITEGYWSLGTTTSIPAGNSSLHTAVPSIAQALGAEYGQIGFGAQGYAKSGQGNVPAFNSAWNLYSAGRPRLVDGLLSPAPDYICVEHGANGTTTQANVQTTIANLRTAAPNARIFIMVPAGGYARSAIVAAVAANASDTKLHLIDLGTEYEKGINGSGGSNMYALDALHRNVLSNARVAAGFTQKMQSEISGAAVDPGNPSDSTAPVLSGQLAVSNVTQNTAMLTCPTASDNVAVTGYEWSVNGGSTYPFTSTVPNKSVTGLPSGSNIQARVRAYDEAGNRSIALATSFSTLPGSVPDPEINDFVPSDARTIKILPNRTEFEVGEFWLVDAIQGPSSEKDPDATIDIPFDWTAWLNDIGEANLSDAVFLLSGGLQNAGSGGDEKKATVFVSGGTPGAQASITCRITTATIPARIDDRTVYLTIKEQ